MSKKLTPKELKRRVKNSKYKRQAKKIRETHAFGDLFSAKSGVDLRSPESWTPAIKARVTKYAKQLGPLIAGETKTKRYFRPDHLKLAIEASPQEKRLPGQKAALFPVDDSKEKVVIEFGSKFDKKTKKKIRVLKKVTRAGIEEMKFHFDMDEFALRPVEELERVLDAAPGQFFKFVTGANESKGTYNAADMVVELGRIIERYEDDPDKNVEDFMFGIKAYPGLKSAKPLTKRQVKHSGLVKKRQRARLNVLSKEQTALTRAEMRSVKATGRIGRVK